MAGITFAILFLAGVVKEKWRTTPMDADVRNCHGFVQIVLFFGACSCAFFGK